HADPLGRAADADTARHVGEGKRLQRMHEGLAHLGPRTYEQLVARVKDGTDHVIREAQPSIQQWEPPVGSLAGHRHSLLGGPVFAGSWARCRSACHPAAGRPHRPLVIFSIDSINTISSTRHWNRCSLATIPVTSCATSIKD